MAQFASDAFGGTENALLSTYNAAWSLHGSYTGTCEIASNRVRASLSTASMYYHSGSPAGADYSVSADLHFLTYRGGGGHMGVAGRIDTAANTLYMARYFSPGWQLYKGVSGTFTQLGSTSSEEVSAASTINIKLEMIGTAIKLYNYGSGTALISATDSAISAAGKAGIRCGAVGSDSDGIHADNFSADDIGSAVLSLPNKRSAARIQHMMVR